MTEFINSLGPFVYGFAIGYFAHPLVAICKKIYSEAKIASQEWRPDK